MMFTILSTTAYYMSFGCHSYLDRAGSAEPVGGISRFQYLASHYRSDPKYDGQSELLTLFSGDAFNPSLESSVTKGGHMVPILNQIPTDAACVGVSMDYRSFRLLVCALMLNNIICRTMILILASPNSSIYEASVGSLGF